MHAKQISGIQKGQKFQNQDLTNHRKLIDKNKDEIEWYVMFG